MKSFEFNINGQTQQFQSRPDEPLLWALRDQLGLTGAKFGCGEGMCGSCTVLIDDQAVRSCLIPVSAVRADSRIETVEGLGQEDNLSTLQTAFVENHAFACGFCTSGQIMSATALLRSNPSPTRSEIVAAMNGNLCRCATYPNILAAIEAAASSES